MGIRVNVYFSLTSTAISQRSSDVLNKNDRLKILRVVSRINIGGPSLHMKILTEGLDDERFETVLLAGILSEHEGDMSYLLDTSKASIKYVPNLQREIHPIKDIMAFAHIFNIIRKERPNFVHTHMAKAGTIARTAAIFYNFVFRKNVKLIHTFHGNVLEGYFNSLLSYCFLIIERTIAKFTDAVIAISKTQKWELVHKYSISNEKKVHVINLGFELKPFLNLRQYEGKLRKSIGVDNECLLIGIVGRLVPIKNHFLFLNAAKEFIRGNPEQSVRFLIVGNGELRSKLGSYAEKIGIHDKVIFWGWEHRIQTIYSGLDILALTSKNEGTPVSIIEAMASGVPVITTGVGGVKDLLGSFEDDINSNFGFKVCERGILCAQNDPKAFAHGIRYIIDDSDKKGEERVRRSREFVIECYSDTRLVREVENLYVSLI